MEARRRVGYGRTYTMTITATGMDGSIARQVSSFTTLTPRNRTKVYLTITATTQLQDEGTYGIGTVVVAHFDEPIPDRAAAERRLSVIISPPVRDRGAGLTARTCIGDRRSTLPPAPW